jgi:AcrR family transcriptional regulator
MVEFIRARSPDQKTERREHLLATARAMLAEGTPLAELSLNALARRAEMTKSNVYRYFESREAMLLEVLMSAWQSWFVGFDARLTKTARPMGLQALTTLLVETIVHEPMLCLLTSAMPSVLEQNVSVEVAHAFKTTSKAQMELVANVVSAACPTLRPAAALQLLHDVIIIMVGLYPMAHPAPAIRAALSDPSLCSMGHDFARDLRRMALGAAVHNANAHPT